MKKTIIGRLLLALNAALFGSLAGLLVLGAMTRHVPAPGISTFVSVHATILLSSLTAGFVSALLKCWSFTDRRIEVGFPEYAITIASVWLVMLVFMMWRLQRLIWPGAILDVLIVLIAGAVAAHMLRRD